MSRLLLKIGGASLDGAAAHVLALADAGHEVVVVHGAGPQITREMARRGLAIEFVRGRRYTDAETLEVVRTCLRAVNAELCAQIGPGALGLMGDEIGLKAERVPHLGFVGDPLASRPAAILSTLEQRRIPVVAPLAAGPLNVNADEMAASLAVGLAADRLVFVTDVPGLLLDGSVVESIGADDADRLLGDGTLQGGILPKLKAAVGAARRGVRAEIGETVVLT